MQSVVYYILGFGAFALVCGGIIMFFALRNAPEGFEDEGGFVGLTKGDEALLKEFNQEHRYSTMGRQMDAAA